MTFLKILSAIFLLAALCRNGAAEELVITAVGDVMLAGSGTPTYNREGYDYPFVKLAPELAKGDLLVGNLEAPIARCGAEFTTKQFRFKTDPRAAAAFKRVGFKVMTLANNHMLDYGAEGLRETLGYLDQQRIGHSGAGENLAAARKEAVVTVKGKTVAVLAYSFTFPEEFYAGSERPGTAPGQPGYYREDIVRAKANYDFVVVSFHWGAEKATEPKPYQLAAAHLAIDAGADLVIGHHPHVLQGIELYKGRAIFYSLGNFVFGSISPTSDRSVIARVTLVGDQQQIELVPLNILNSEIRYQPVVLAGASGEAVIDSLNELCRPLGTSIVWEGGSYWVAGVKEQSQPVRE
jgi:poly-gamma-glutamate capsule biosynthesis protein CapA/YwtB (metallophosphatase superfamily)